MKSYIQIYSLFFFIMNAVGQQSVSSTNIQTKIVEADMHLLIGVGEFVKIEANGGGYDSALYKITETNRGEFYSQEIHIAYLTNTVQGSLPNKAILLVTPFLPVMNEKTHESWRSVYRALGTEAWRGILPYTSETWERIKATPSEELLRTPPGQELPKEKAIELAKQEILNRGLSSEYNRVHRVRRKPFGWRISIVVVNLTSRGDYSASSNTIDVSDSGQVLNYSSPTCGNEYLKIKPEESIEAKLDEWFPDSISDY